MKLISKPTRSQLAGLQQVLNSESDVGIKDLYGPLVTHHIGAGVSGVRSELCGAAALSIKSMGGGGELYKLYVAPPFRGTGVGRFLVSESLVVFSQHGIEEVYIEVTAQSIYFWNVILAGLRYEIVGDRNAIIFLGNA